ncbi:MAG: hypothetical protein RIR00_1804 [Pseudomonadota bacterium]|jgi:iron complex outermembrane receptor protein
MLSPVRSRHLLKPLALLIATLPLLAKAEDSQVSEVRITASKQEDASARVNQRERDQLSAATSDTANLLRDIPGVSLYGAGGVSSLPAIHGLADDRLRTKVDGMDMIASCPNHMNSPLSYLDPTQVGNLKVYAGISPVSLGGDSIGGVIVADSRNPEFAAPGQGTLLKGEIGARYRSNGNSQSVNASATLATESISLTYSGAMTKADNYKAGGDFKNYTATGRQGHELARNEVGSTAYDARNHLLTLALRGGNHLFEAKLGYQDIPYELYPNQRMDMLGNEQTRLNLRYLGQFDWGNLEARLYHERVNHYMDFGPDKRYWYGTSSNVVGQVYGQPCSPLSSTCAAGMPMYTEGKTSGLSVKGEFSLSPADLLRIGTELQAYRLDDWWPPSGGGMWPGTFWNINNGQRDRSAVYGEWERTLNPSWSTQLGLRYEQVHSNTGNVVGYSSAVGAMGNQVADAAAFNALNRDRKDQNWDMSALARHQHSEALDVEFGYAHKTRSPNLYERYTWSTWTMAAVMNNYVGDGNGYIGNPELRPEQADTLSATLDWHGADREWQASATPFYTRVRDYIDVTRVTNNATGYNALRYSNQRAELYGLDLAGKMPLGRNDLGRFGLKGSASYVHGSNLDTGSGLYNQMPLNGRLSLTQAQGNWNNALEVVGVSSKTRLSTVRNEVRTPGYGLVNLRSSYQWSSVRVDFGVENLFDRSYLLPLGGAYTGQGRTMSINPPGTDGMFGWGQLVPGMGRSIYLGVNLKF